MKEVQRTDIVIDSMERTRFTGYAVGMFIAGIIVGIVLGKIK